MLFGLAGLSRALRQHQRLLDSTPLWLALLFFAQWLMIVPHELGHAVTGKFLGFRQIRILVGSGKPLFNFEFLSFQWLFNRWPFGGLTLAPPSAAMAVRWKQFLFVAGGPAVNISAATVGWLVIGRQALFDETRTPGEILFWANLIVLVENLIPWRVQTVWGPMQTDGLLLWNIIFRWNRPPSVGPQPIPRWEIIVSQGLKVLIVTIMFGATALFGFLIWFFLPFRPVAEDLALWAKFLGATLFFALMMLSAWAAWRCIKNPVARVRQNLAEPLLVRGDQELRARSQWAAYDREAAKIMGYAEAGDFTQAYHLMNHLLERYPNDLGLLAVKADLALKQGQWTAAEKFFDEAISLVPDQSSAAYSRLQIEKLRCIIQQGEIDRADRLSAAYLDGPTPKEDKAQFLDALVCQCLFQEPSPFLDYAERWARKALDLTPGVLTLKGTLGSVLTERANFAEAEPLLRDCLDRSPALHDQGIASLYLGMIAAGRGEAKEAKKLLRYAMVQNPDGWLLQKAKHTLENLPGLEKDAPLS